MEQIQYYFIIFRKFYFFLEIRKKKNYFLNGNVWKTGGNSRLRSFLTCERKLFITGPYLNSFSLLFDAMRGSSFNLKINARNISRFSYIKKKLLPFTTSPTLFS